MSRIALPFDGSDPSRIIGNGKGRRPFRIVASAEYDQLHSVVKMKEDMLDLIGKLI